MSRLYQITVCRVTAPLLITLVSPFTFLYLRFDIIQSHDPSPTQHQNGDNTQGHHHADNDNWWVFFCTHLHLHLQLITTTSSPMTRRTTGSKSHHSEDGSQPARQRVAVADWQPMAARPTVTTAHSLRDITSTTTTTGSQCLWGWYVRIRSPTFAPDVCISLLTALCS